MGFLILRSPYDPEGAPQPPDSLATDEQADPADAAPETTKPVKIGGKILPPVKPPQSHSEEVIKALELHGDQAQSAERDIAPGLSLAIGIRNVYLNNDGDVVVLARIRAG